MFKDGIVSKEFKLSLVTVVPTAVSTIAVIAPKLAPLMAKVSALL